MQDIKNIKDQFQKEREKLFRNKKLLIDSLKFCIAYSLLVEEYIYKVLSGKKLDGVLAAAGSFSRRELSPYSDIDLMFIIPEADKNADQIKEFVTSLWDSGIEVSHTVRQFSDINKFLEDDLHAFTQFFETRFLFGKK